MKELKIQQKFLDWIKSGEKTFEIRKKDFLKGPIKLVCDNSGDYLIVNLQRSILINKKNLLMLFNNLYYLGFWETDIYEAHRDFIRKDYDYEYYRLYNIEKIEGYK